MEGRRPPFGDAFTGGIGPGWEPHFVLSKQSGHYTPNPAAIARRVAAGHCTNPRHCQAGTCEQCAGADERCRAGRVRAHTHGTYSARPPTHNVNKKEAVIKNSST